MLTETGRMLMALVTCALVWPFGSVAVILMVSGPGASKACVTVVPSTLDTAAPFSSRSATIAALPSGVNDMPDNLFSATFT